MLRHVSSLLLLLCLCLPCHAITAQQSPYGICAHVTRGDEFETRDRQFQLTRGAGISWVRSDFDWNGMETAPGQWSFQRMDALLASAEKAGVQMLPILGYTTSFADPTRAHLDMWADYVRHVVSRYGRRLPVLEVWNEQNLWDCWGDDKVGAYTELLKTTYDTAKSVDPSLRVAVGGYSGIPLQEIERLYEQGGGAYFDIMNVHPYSQPAPPESYLEGDIARLKAVMAKHGDAAKPIWITEIGWPTHKPQLVAPGLIRAGLSAARPGKADPWTVAILDDPDFSTHSAPPSELLVDELPAGSRVLRLPMPAFDAAMEGSTVDAVVLPFDEQFSVDDYDKLLGFVRRGGVMIDMGGMPFWYSLTRGAHGQWVPKVWANGEDGGRFCRDLRVGVEAFWYNKAVIPEKVTARFVGPAGTLPQPQNGFVATRYLKPDGLRAGDEFIPLIAGTEGTYTGVAAAVYRYGSDMKGAALFCTLSENAQTSVTPERQAVFLPRTYLIALQLGIERVFWYKQQAAEAQPQDPESHFGIVHHDLSPKPAYMAYRTLTKERPAGSTVLTGLAWKSADGAVYFPQWRRPDGVLAGAVWVYRKPGQYRLTFSSANVKLTAHDGRPIAGAGAVRVINIGDAPVYYVGGTLRAIRPAAGARGKR